MSKESRRASRNARVAARNPSSGPSGASRAGRRERVRHVETKKPFIQRYRTAIIGVVVVAIAAVAVGLIFVQSTQASYTCSIEFDPSPTPSPSPGESFRLGFAQDNMGAIHQVSRPQRYTFCPPASGNHYNQPGVLGPIVPRVYGPNDSVGPSNWIHNLEHGGMVVLYRGDSPGATDAGQALFKTFFNSFPPSPICQDPAGPHLAGHRPVRRHEVAVRGARLGPGIAAAGMGPGPRAAVLRDRVGTARRRGRVRGATGAAVRSAGVERGARLVGRAERVGRARVGPPAAPASSAASPSPSAAPS